MQTIIKLNTTDIKKMLADNFGVEPDAVRIEGYASSSDGPMYSPGGANAEIFINEALEAMKRPDSFRVLSKEERIQQLKAQIWKAGDRHDWDECEELEKELEELEGEDDGIHED